MKKFNILVILAIFNVIVCGVGSIISDTYIMGWWLACICTVIQLTMMEHYGL